MFPLIINLQKEKVVIVGGGEVGYHKTLNLLKFNIRPTVISKQFVHSFKQLELEGKVILQQKLVEWSDLADAFLIILVTNDEQVNDTFAKKAKEAGKLIVHASDVRLGNALVPATLQRGKLILSVSTSGASPTLAKNIRDEWAEQYDKTYEGYVDFLYEVRQLVKVKFAERTERRKWLKEATSAKYINNLAARAELLNKIT